MALAGEGAICIWNDILPEHRADFTFINRGETKTLDLNRISWAQDIRTAYILWEGLYTIDPVRTLGPVLGCAGKVDLSDDQTVYTFHIRPEAKWTNGDDVTAHDFIFCWRRNLEEAGRTGARARGHRGPGSNRGSSRARIGSVSKGGRR